MKTIHCLFLLGYAILSTRPLLAETDIAREMNQLQDQHTKEVNTAIEPLNRRYQSALEQLLRRATEAKDADTAAKIQEQLTALNDGAAAAAVQPHYTKETLAHMLTTSEWTWSPNRELDRSNSTRVTITKDQFVMGGKLICAYKVIDAFTVQLDKRILKSPATIKASKCSTGPMGRPAMAIV
jgi:hypothetical protein